MTKERKKLLFIFILLNGLSIISTLVFCFIFKPLTLLGGGEKSTCVFQKLFGFYCPGCGGTRSLAYLLTFDFVSSFVFYPPILIGISLIIFTDFIIFKAFLKNNFNIVSKRKWREFLLIPASIILNFIFKNTLLYFNIDLLGDFL